MRMRMILLAALAASAAPAAGCSDDSGVPTSAELYGTWVAQDDMAGIYRVFVFAAADDGGHPELADMANVYVLYRYPVGDPPTQIQTGHYEVEEVVLNEGGEEVTDDALVTVVVSDAGGVPPGTRYGNGIDDWTGDALTLRSVGATTATFTRSPDDTLP
jgi:hypothetical protein